MFEQLKEFPRFAKWLIGLNRQMIKIFRERGSINSFDVEYEVPEE